MKTKLPVNVTLQALFYIHFALFQFYRSFQCFSFGCLGGVAFIRETKFRFAASSFCKDYIYHLYYSAGQSLDIHV